MPSETSSDPRVLPGFRGLLQPALRAGRTLADLHLGRGLGSGGWDDREVLPAVLQGGLRLESRHLDMAVDGWKMMGVGDTSFYREMF